MNYKKILIPVILIMLAISISSYYRLYPVNLPQTDQWAENTIINNIRRGVATEIEKTNPNLPDNKKAEEITKGVNEIISNQKTQFENEVGRLSQQFKNEMKYDNGQTYLLAIDPYYWYTEARLLLEDGEWGNGVNKDGDNVITYRSGRVGKTSADSQLAFFPMLQVWVYKLVHFFNRDHTLLSTAFLMPVIIIGLSLIPAFFIVRKLAGNAGGFAAAVIIAINGALLGRTPAGFSDTDPFQIFFPLMITWLFFEAVESKQKVISYALSILAGLFTLMYSMTWGAWWYIFNFLIVAMGVVVFINFFIYKEINYHNLVVTCSFVVSSLFFIYLVRGMKTVLAPFNTMISVIRIKDVAVNTIFPNVMTTVAEFNKVKMATIIPQMGGKLFFFLGTIGLLLLLLKKIGTRRDLKYFLLMAIWFGGALYAFTKGQRFGILLLPVIAIGIGVSIGFLWDKIKWLLEKKEIQPYGKKGVWAFVGYVIILFLMFVPLFNTAHAVAYREMPSMNDAWYQSLTEIKEDADDSIITSWWDFGHWFYTISERRVTFDGGDQGQRIHWVGKSLLTSNEKESVGILRMLNCGQDQAPHKINKYKKNMVESINILNKILVQDVEEARQTLLEVEILEEGIKEILDLTHCEDVLPQYFITSGDMVGKAGVWGHFGSWDFNRAQLWNTINKASFTEGKRILQEEYNFSPTDASTIYKEIKNANADNWVSPWPSYGRGNEYMLSTNQTLTMHPLLSESMFTRLFFENGEGLEHFKIFSERTTFNGLKIKVWKVNLNIG